MHCMLMDLLHGFEVLSTTEETLFNSRYIFMFQANNKNVIITRELRERASYSWMPSHV